jgi:NADH-quinone oxidoreductase subunit H
LFELGNLIKAIYDWLEGLFANWGIPHFWLDILSMFIVFGMIVAFISIAALFLVWWERKVSAHMQVRFGPMRTGWHGWRQTIIDAIKLIMKEDIVPAKVDKAVFVVAPIVVFVSALMVYVWILYILAITTFTVVGLLMAGFGSNNKYSLLGGLRSAAQIVSYEVPLTLSVLGVVLLAQSLSMVTIVTSQTHVWDWFVFRQPIGFLVYLTAAVAEVNRTPFDIPEAEQELVAGYNVEYSGMKFAMFFFAEYTNLFTISAVSTTLFLGGWNGPWLPSWIWFLGKTFLVILVIIWFRWTYPRIRVDQLMGFAWKFLLPLAFLNLIVTGLFA